MTKTISRLLVSGAAFGSLVLAPTPAGANGLTVFDPTNYAQNILQASRALEQINHQIQSLQNEALSLVNQAKNLASLPYSSLQQLQASVRQTQALLNEARGIAHRVGDIDQAFHTTYAPASASASKAELVAGARARWRQSVDALQDALRVQAGVVGNIETNRTEMAALVGSSQSAQGALQATQAGNQILALQTQQLSDLTATLAAQGRAQAFDSAQRMAAQDLGRENLRRFLGSGRGYQPTVITMFRR
ncbi:MAG: P-type conjugative transfer protein TrbJ [Pseudomonadota bacterium]